MDQPKMARMLRLMQLLASNVNYSVEELMDKLAQCDLYVHASDMESEAISCIEAFATGLVPVISDSDLSATKQFALDRRSLFRAGDPKDLARAIDYWLDNPEEKARMEKVYAEAAKNYDIEHSVALFEEMLLEAIEDHKKQLEANQWKLPVGETVLPHGRKSA